MSQMIEFRSTCERKHGIATDIFIHISDSMRLQIDDFGFVFYAVIR